MESQTSARNGRASAGELAGRLGGDLRCMRCAYDLAGLSITSSCPECGLAIKATLLSVVDPKAEVLAPLVRPLLVAWSLVLWSLGGVLLVLAGWGARVHDLAGGAGGAGGVTPARHALDAVAIAGLAAILLGSPALIRPVRRVPRREVLFGAAGLVLIVLSAFVVVYLHVRIDHHLSPYIEPVPLLRTAFHALAMLLAAAGLLGVRPMLRRLAERSWVLRHGRVQRQPLLALAAALGVAAIGDGLAMLGDQMTGTLSGWLHVGHMVLVALGSVLFTVGAVNLLRDALRLRPVLASRPIGLEGVMDDGQAPGSVAS
ncbi:MAG: hypothetical protein AAF356_02100 [Planctomycetota bacterium]